MTNKERVRRCGRCQPIDRVPFSFYFGPWDETYRAWEKEGVTGLNTWRDEKFGFDAPVIQLANYVNHHFWPGIEGEIIERRGDVIIAKNGWGQVTETIEGVDGIPKILKSPVETMDDWVRLKAEQLNPNDPGRFPDDWQDKVAWLKEQDAPLQIGIYPCGLYGMLRDLMGVEGSLMAFYDQPELVQTILDNLTDFWLVIYEKICQDLQVDILHIWEDMSGKQGSLISPKMVKKYMLPNYRKLRDFADAHDIAIFQVDTDGDCEELIPLFLESGVNMMLPFEVMAGCDVVAWRKKYPEMSMMGGIDKMEIAKGPEAIDKEIARIEPLLKETGYFPALDHLIPPEISYANYTYFTNRLREAVYRHVRPVD